jgi:predicted RNase H-like HicB family nuclease
MTNIIRTDGNRVVNVSIEVQLIQEGDYVVSYCPALELSSFGATEEEAKDGFEGALHTFIDETHKRGTLERVLLDLGWQLKKNPVASYKPPRQKIRGNEVNPSLIRSFKESVDLPV